MQEIIPPIDRSLIKAELNDRTFLRDTNKGDNELYVIDSCNGPNTLKELGRLREVAFRDGGGGTGLALDLDEYDTHSQGYKQLLVWDPEGEEIVGGYRYSYCPDCFLEDGKPFLSTTELFDFSSEFCKNILPKSIELGRSFVQPQYQPQNNPKGLFSLDNLWDGLGALIVEFKDIDFLFGKVTMYTTYNHEARDILLIFLHQYFGDSRHMVIAKPGLKLELYDNRDDYRKEIQGLSFKEAYQITNQKIKDLGEKIPPLINSYMNISPSMKVFDTAVNHHFGDVEETGILIKISDIYEDKKERYISTFHPQTDNLDFLRCLCGIDDSKKK